MSEKQNKTEYFTPKDLLATHFSESERENDVCFFMLKVNSHYGYNNFTSTVVTWTLPLVAMIPVFATSDGRSTHYQWQQQWH